MLGVSKLTDKISVFDSEMSYDKLQKDLPSVSGATLEHSPQDGSNRDMKKSITMVWYEIPSKTWLY